MTSVNVVRDVFARIAHSPREFGAGWIEGRWRYNQAAGAAPFPPSWFEPGSVGRAASQAAIAFYLSRDGRD